MNFLAHLYLAGPDPDARVGNLMGDFLKGVDLAAYSPAIREGVRLHCRIDAFTDEHEIVRRCKRLVSSRHSRYAGVLVDVYFDHLLARSWSHYSPDSLATFSAQVYDQLLAAAPMLPERMALASAAMAREDWLGSYASLGGIELTLTRVARRLKRPHPLGEAVADLEREYPAFEQAFHEFFPELIAFVGRERR